MNSHRCKCSHANESIMQQFYGRLGKYQQTVFLGAQKAWRAFKSNYRLDFPIMNEAGVQCAVQVCNIGKMRIQKKTESGFVSNLHTQ